MIPGFKCVYCPFNSFRKCGALCRIIDTSDMSFKDALDLYDSGLHEVGVIL